MDTVKKEGKVTPEEVMAIIGNDDPFKAGASAIRMAIGRGSNSTIQKIINELRQEAAENQKTGMSEKVPPASPEVFESIWTTAYNCAMSSVLVRMEKLSSERDVLIATSIAQTKDIESFSLEVDQLLEKLAAAEELAEETALTVQMQAATEKAKADQIGQELSVAKEQLSRVKAETTATVQMAAHDQALVKETLQRTIDGLTFQVAEYKGLLFSRDSYKSSEKHAVLPNEIDFQLE